MRFLVTGGAGFIGSNYVRKLVDGSLKGASEITVIDKLTYAGDMQNLASIPKDSSGAPVPFKRLVPVLTPFASDIYGKPSSSNARYPSVSEAILRKLNRLSLYAGKILEDATLGSIIVILNINDNFSRNIRFRIDI